MKILFITAIILSVAAVHGEQIADEPNAEPCQMRVSPLDFENFVKKHVITESFDRADRERWGK